MKKLFLIFTFFLLVLLASSQSKVDSLLRVSEKTDEKKLPEIYLQISFITREDTAKSNSYVRMAYSIAMKNNQVQNLAKSFYYFGDNCYFSRDYIGAIPYYEHAIKYYKELKDTFSLTNCYSSIGLSYHYMSQDTKAIPYFIDALKMSENNKEYTAEILANIALCHAQMHNEKYAIEYYRKAAVINQEIKDTVSLAVDYNGIAASFLVLQQNDSSLFYYTKAHDLFKKTHKHGYQAIALANMGSVYVNYPDSLDKAKIVFSEALNKFKELGLNQYEADIKEGIGKVLCRQGKYKEAIETYNLSLKLTDQYNRGYSLKTSIYKGLSETYEKTENFKLALKFQILYTQYTDSLVQKEKHEQIVNLEKQYETEKKENEIIKLQAQQQLTDIQLTKNKQLKILGFVTASLLLLLVLFGLSKYFDKLKSNNLLEEKNRLIEKSEQELRLLNASKNKFFSIIAHDLKNPLHNVMGYSFLLSKDYDKFTEEERRKFATDINQSTNNIFRLLQNLLEWSRSQTGRLKFSPIEIQFKRVLDNALSVLHSLASQKQIKLEYNQDPNLKVFADPMMIETVIRNLISNAIKFTPENGTIGIEAKNTGNEVLVSVKDSGIGLSEADLANLFRIDSKVKRKGTNNEDGSGLGLVLCKEFVDKNNGSIWVESTPGKGSTFFFSIPAPTNA
jgi:signal transduction histidine kinase